MTSEGPVDRSVSGERIDAIQTRWSLIRNAHLAGQGHTVADARRLMVLRYAPAIRRYVGGMVRNSDLADEISQDIVVRMMQGDFASADPSRGRFRDLLITSIRNMVRTFWSRSRRREMESLKLQEWDPRLAAAEETEWLCAWRQSILDQSWNRLAAEEGNAVSPAVIALRLRTEHPDADSRELAGRLQSRIGRSVTPESYRQMLSRVRCRFAEHLLDEIRASLNVESDEAVQEELAALQLLELVRDHLKSVRE